MGVPEEIVDPSPILSLLRAHQGLAGLAGCLKGIEMSGLGAISLLPSDGGRGRRDGGGAIVLEAGPER